MAELVTVARPYAKAVFQYAIENNQLSEWSEMLAFAAAVAKDPDMVEMLHKPQFTSGQKADLFYSVCSEKLTEAGKNFIYQLAQSKRLIIVPQISELYELLKAEQEKTVDVSVIAAYELSDQEEAKLSETLQKRLGREVKISSEVDKSLLGGLVIRAGDLVIDGSVRGKLAKLSEHLKS
ncbi:MAG: F0F1 ATP synthase subunit delta [Moraxellaceae bacterium]|nr:MAG: F0F1 ATP synthase subunit delta [Moraxellaceae bacterium]